MKKLTPECLSIITSRPQISHKGTFGRVVLIGGNQQYGGAIMMAAEACVRSGAGLVTVVTDPVNHTELHARLPEVMVVDWYDLTSVQEIFVTADVCLVGPGLGLEIHGKTLLSFVLNHQQAEQQLIIDGSGITLFAASAFTLPFPSQTVFTPHQMEWQRLSGLAIAQQSEAANKHAQHQLQATIVLKSRRTEIYSCGPTVQNPLGNPAMATGGMGDTLAGMIAGFLAQFSEKGAIQAAVYLHSYIGDLLAKERYVVLPTEISAALPYWMKKFSDS